MQAGAETWLRRLHWQPTLFAEEPPRPDVADLRAGWPCRRIAVNVHRNTVVEAVVSLLPPFLAYADLDADVEIGPYDDSFAFAAVPPADVDIVVCDLRRYGDGAGPPFEWLSDRTRALRSLATGSVLVVALGDGSDRWSDLEVAMRSAASTVPGVHVCPVADVAASFGDRWTDQRLARLAGTDLSGVATVALAQRLGLSWIPAAVQPPLKAVVVDLDNTLYEGVLGEDGPEGVVVTPDHRLLQERIVELHDAGLLVGVLSRNAPADVEALFAARDDFPLSPAHVDAWQVGWGDRMVGLAGLAEELRIGLDAVVVVDDNPGELAAIGASNHGVRVVHASTPATARRALVLHPGLVRLGRTHEDEIRSADLSAARARDRAAASAADADQYLRSLEATLELRFAGHDDLARAAELSAKTNQFNTALRRFGAADLARRVEAGDVDVVVVSLRDRLSDSGTIASVVASRRDGVVVVEEIAISCRALGRRLEDVIVLEAVRVLSADFGARIEVDFVTGDRNGPALAWLQRHAGDLGGGTGAVPILTPPDDLRHHIETAPAAVAWSPGA